MIDLYVEYCVMYVLNILFHDKITFSFFLNGAKISKFLWSFSDSLESKAKGFFVIPYFLHISNKIK